MKSGKPTLTAQEFGVMKIVWARGSATVRDVYEELLKRRKIAYTTVTTMMRILEQKGHLKKSADERAHVYRPSQPQREIVGNMVRDFLQRVFNGSAKLLLIQLVEDKKISPNELFAGSPNTNGPLRDSSAPDRSRITSSSKIKRRPSATS